MAGQIPSCQHTDDQQPTIRCGPANLPAMGIEGLMWLQCLSMTLGQHQHLPALLLLNRPSRHWWHRVLDTTTTTGSTSTGSSSIFSGAKQTQGDRDPDPAFRGNAVVCSIANGKAGAKSRWRERQAVVRTEYEYVQGEVGWATCIWS